MIIALYALLNRPLGEVDKIHIARNVASKGKRKTGVCVWGGRQRETETRRDRETDFGVRQTQVHATFKA